MDSDGIRAFTHLAFPPSESPLEILTADRAQVIITTWKSSPLGNNVAVTLWNELGAGKDVEVLEVSATRLRLDRAAELAQAALLRNAPTDRSLELAAAGAHCTIAHSRPGDAVDFPEDPKRLAGAMTFKPDGRHLRADCDAVGAYSHAPYGTLLYGMDLTLASSEDSRTIRTGTFDEPDDTGVGVRTVTRIVRVNARDDSLEVYFGLPSHVTMFAPRIVAVGRLASGPSAGNLTWMPWEQKGRVEPFEATGTFAFEARSAENVGVEGTTLTGPPVAGASGDAAAPAPMRWAAAVAGLGALALAAWLLWGLFARLGRDRVLDHPRRRQILDVVRKAPGVSASSVARQLQIPWVKTVFHVRCLTANGHLAVRRVDGRTALFLVGAAAGPAAERLALLHRPAFRGTLDALVAQPGLDQAALCARLGLGQSRVSKILTRLRQAGIVTATRKGNRLVYAANARS